MHKRTTISAAILLAAICLLLGCAILSPKLLAAYFSHWLIISTLSLVMTLLLGLVLMDDLFELDDSFAITFKKPGLKIEIKKYLVWALLIVGFVAVTLEVIQFLFSQNNANWADPLVAISGSIAGIVIHVIGSKRLMKKVEFELERWEDNVL
jgi:hypothetical protein